MRCLRILVLCTISVVSCGDIEHDYKGFDDTILFGINWPGTDDAIGKVIDGDVSQDQDLTNDSNKDAMKVVTSNKEKYECSIPELKPYSGTYNIENYAGLSPTKLLEPLFAQKICSYRLESYWSYEVCHGRYIRQYHEEREGKNIKTQEFTLGKVLEPDNLFAQIKEPLEKTKVEGLSLPFVEVVMGDGTVCDLNNKPRVTKVRYVCYNHGKHEVYSFKETATCEYEIVILSPLLCEHPQFRPKEVSENIIHCYAVGDSPKKPRSLLKQEVESLRFQHQTIRSLNNLVDKNQMDKFVDKLADSDMLAVFKVEKIQKDGTSTLKLEFHPLKEEHEDEASSAMFKDRPLITDDSPVRAFLNGENCLTGGSGWWKYEFCYGKHVMQYHVDRVGEKTSLLLGTFDKETHLQWIKENKGKVPKPIGQRTSISHFYSNGDVCDKTGKPRQTEVKLKCLENSSSPAQVSLYLLEPRVCNYILGIESPLICDILPYADETGLIKERTLVTIKKEDRDERKAEDVTDREENKPMFGND